MSHNICVYIFKADAEKFREAFPKVVYALSHDGQYIITPAETYNLQSDQFRDDIILKHKLTDTVVRAITDYFGGVGEQEALVTQFMSRSVYQASTNCNVEPYENMVPLQHFTTNSINRALRFIGVQSTPELDEFDVIGLGRWRSNEDFYE